MNPLWWIPIIGLGLALAGVLFIAVVMWLQRHTRFTWAHLTPYQRSVFLPYALRIAIKALKVDLEQPITQDIRNQIADVMNGYFRSNHINTSVDGDDVTFLLLESDQPLTPIDQIAAAFQGNRSPMWLLQPQPKSQKDGQ